MSDSEEEVPLRARQRSRPVIGSLKEESSSEDDALTVQKAKTARRKTSNKQKPPSPLSNQDSDVSDDIPIKATAKRKRTPNTTNGTAKKRIKKESESASKAQSRVRKPRNSKSSTTDEKSESRGEKTVENAAKRLKKERSESIKPEDDEDAEQEESFKWWEAEQQDGTQKWTTLSHNGVLFPPAYEPLPKDVKMLYDGVPVDLPIEAEEVAGFFGAMLETDHAKNPVFRQNFFNDFLEVLDEAGGCGMDIKEFERCDFRPIYDYYEVKRLEKKNMTSAEKKAIKAEKDKTEEKYKTCLLDGRRELVGSFRIEPPGLFRGRGKHPKTGKLKKRVLPEQVTLNIGAEEAIPKPPAGHTWAEVKHDNTVSWLATWKENINGATKYVFLAANSSLKGMSDMKKFEKARELKKHVDKIRSAYRKELKDPLMAIRQRATAIYLIDVFALRAGGEKGEDEADTVGCCSLRYEHVTLSPPNKVTFDFLGKDSIRFHQEVEVDPLVFKNLKIFKKEPKGPGDDIFDRLDPPTLNKYLQSYMPGLTAKVFRTYNASITMQRLIDKIPNEGSVNEKIVAFNAANREVAILCNHQRTVAKSHEAAMEKIEDRINEIRWNIQRHKSLILQLDMKQAKKRKEYFAPDPALDDETVQGIKDRIIERERVKIQKKFAKDNEKLVAEGEKPLPEKELKERLKHADELDEELSEEIKTGNMQIRNGMTVEKAEGHISKLQERLDNMNWQKKDKQDNSTVALTTSKINYIDPRLTVMYTKKFNVPLEKLFSKTLREKFNWAVESADENWSF